MLRAEHRVTFVATMSTVVADDLSSNFSWVSWFQEPRRFWLNGHPIMHDTPNICADVQVMHVSMGRMGGLSISSLSESSRLSAA